MFFFIFIFMVYFSYSCIYIHIHVISLCSNVPDLQKKLFMTKCPGSSIKIILPFLEKTIHSGLWNPGFAFR